MAAPLNKQLERVLKDITDKQILKQLGEFIVEMLVDRVRGQGQGVKQEDGNRTDLSPLSPGYIRQRARDRSLHPETSPERSNLTRTGEMLDSLRYRIKDGRVEIYVAGGNKVVNKAIYTNESRPWVNLGRAEKTLILKMVEELISKKL